MRKKVIFLFFIVCLLSALLISCSGGGSPTAPPIDDEQESPANITDPELIEIASKEINLEDGGVVEVTDPESELYGLKLTIEPQKNIRKDKGLPVTNIVIYLALLETCKLPDFQGFLITPFIIKSDFTDVLFGKLEIPYWEEQLKNAGVAKNAPVKVCRVSSSLLPWVELSSDKYTVSNNIANIPIGIEDFMYYYTLTVNNAVPPNSSGFKSPQPGDLLYKFSKLPPANINEGWCSGHVGIYVGEKYDEEEKKPYNVIEALLGGVTRSYHSPISEFGGNSIYLGAREPKSGLLDEQRNKIVAFAENAVGTPYSFIDTLTSMIYSGLGRGNLVKGYGNDFNCVGLAEAAYEYAGIDLVSNYDEGNEIYGPYHILTPAEQYNKTVPADGYSDEQAIRDVIHGIAQALSDRDWDKARSYCVYGSVVYNEINEMEQGYYNDPSEWVDYIVVDNINPIIINGQYAEALVYFTDVFIINGEVEEYTGEQWHYLQKIGNDWKYYDYSGEQKNNLIEFKNIFMIHL